MAVLETSYRWDFEAAASTRATLKAFHTKAYAQALSFYIESGPGCTASVVLESRAGSSSGVYQALSTQTLSTSAVAVVQLLGPLAWVRPRADKSTGALTVTLLGN